MTMQAWRICCPIEAGPLKMCRIENNVFTCGDGRRIENIVCTVQYLMETDPLRLCRIEKIVCTVLNGDGSFETVPVWENFFYTAWRRWILWDCAGLRTFFFTVQYLMEMDPLRLCRIEKIVFTVLDGDGSFETVPDWEQLFLLVRIVPRGCKVEKTVSLIIGLRTRT